MIDLQRCGILFGLGQTRHSLNKGLSYVGLQNRDELALQLGVTSGARQNILEGFRVALDVLWRFSISNKNLRTGFRHKSGPKMRIARTCYQPIRIPYTCRCAFLYVLQIREPATSVTTIVGSRRRFEMNRIVEIAKRNILTCDRSFSLFYQLDVFRSKGTVRPV